MCQSKSHGHGQAHGHHHHGHDHHHGPESTRREALRRIGKAGLVLAAAGSPWGSPVRAIADDQHPVGVGPASDRLFDLKRVAEGIYAAIARPTAMLNCNAAVVVNKDHVLVVDTHSKPSAARALIQQIRAEVTELPVRYVVDSHLHGDHAMGNEAYPEAFGPSVETISSVKTREWLEKLGLPRLRASLEPLPRQIADFRARLEASTDESRRAVLKAQIEGLEAYLKEMTPPRVTLPTMTFERRLVLHRGGREVHLMFLGRAHTAGDVVAYIPSERTIATGDLMHGLLPYMGDGFPDEWPATLRALEALDFDRVIPGHGAVQEGKSVLAEFRGYVEEVNEKVADGVERGRPLDELQKSVTPGTLRSLADAGARRRLERELGALFTLEKPEDQVVDGVAGNVREVFTYYTERKGQAELPTR
ncbi:MBL fold metallo-hydrolase [Paludisphaera mucosa]|uniref:MBL fold metallo-hydrolase n=1 Tax=Paludisphaera mucosa TaxID=3030827 RepID=A0ABT6F488_9BACT|nr:MBL fold metallo-hydrolase [Paludisphaera mucosa]MDG3002397.1 MBL fold metallo-hydrolase [Paludisphaera mucosa]